VHKVSNKLGIQLGRGEIEAIALATDGLLLIDDEAAYTVAINMGRDSVGTLALLLLMVSRKMISKKRALEALDTMIDAGFWLSPRLVLVFNKKINKIT
jgi:predicted nucleic acid-binding protein